MHLFHTLLNLGHVLGKALDLLADRQGRSLEACRERSSCSLISCVTVVLARSDASRLWVSCVLTICDRASNR